ncbi:MAG: ATP-binding protein [Caldicoprobacterales bacterium]|jgi:hypothetical protein|nr:ATP-binding protein [Clostridiales bacterium]
MEDISLHILDLVQNSIAAGATLVEVFIRELPNEDHIWVQIRDNGRGMCEHQLSQVSNPFYTTRTTRKVGLGIPLFRASAEASGGSLQIQSHRGKGTTLLALFHSNHIDCLPIGKLEDTMAALIFMNPEVNFVYRHEISGRQFQMDTREIREILSEVNITDPDVIDWIKDYIKEGLEELNGGA